MLLRELFFADKTSIDNPSNNRYDNSHDKSVVEKGDTRKTRLTLKQINELRKSTEQHILEQEKELEFIQNMYKAPEEAAAPAV